MASNGRDTPLPSFRIRNFKDPRAESGSDKRADPSPIEDTVVRNITRRDYERLLHSTPQAALAYLDDDDGDYITVGSSFELAQRLREPSSHRAASGGPSPHTFMLQHPNLQVRTAWTMLISKDNDAAMYPNSHSSSGIAFGEPAPLGRFQPAGTPTKTSTGASSASSTQQENRWASYGVLPKTFTEKAVDTRSINTSPARSAPRTTDPKTPVKPLLELYEEELAKLMGRDSAPMVSKATLPEAIGRDGDVSSLSSQNAGTTQETRSIQRPLFEMYEAQLRQLKSQRSASSAPQPASIPDPPETELPQSSTHSSNAENDAAPNTPADLFIASLKGVVNGVNALSTTILNSNPEFRQRIEQTHRDLPAPVQALLRTGMAVADQLSGRQSAAQDQGSEPSVNDSRAEASAPPSQQGHQRTAAANRHFEAEKILARRYICYDSVDSEAKYRQYLVRWAGCGPEHDVWYDEENLLSSCQPLVEAFERENPERPEGERSYEENHLSVYDSASTHCRTAGDRMVTFKRYTASETSQSPRPGPVQDISSIDGRVGGLQNNCSRPRTTKTGKARVSFVEDPAVPSQPNQTSGDCSPLGDAAAGSGSFSFDPAAVMAKYPPISRIPETQASSSREPNWESRTDEWLGLRRAKTVDIRDVMQRPRYAGELRRSGSLAYDPSSAPNRTGPLGARDGPRAATDLVAKISSCVEHLVSMGYTRSEAHPVASIVGGDLHAAIDQLEEDKKAWRRRSLHLPGKMPGAWDRNHGW